MKAYIPFELNLRFCDSYWIKIEAKMLILLGKPKFCILLPIRPERKKK